MFRRLILQWCLSCVLAFTFAKSARILGIMNMPSYSHQLTFRPLWRELAKRGYDVTLITPNPQWDESVKNLREIDVSFTYDIKRKFDTEWNTHNLPYSQQKNMFISVYFNITDTELRLPQVKMLIHNKHERFDLVMAEYLFPHSLLAFANRFNCPFIGLVSLDPNSVSYAGIGNPNHPILYPGFMSGLSGNLSFRERLLSLFGFLYINLPVMELMELQDKITEQHFGKGYPPMQDIFKNVSMLFVNKNPVLHSIRPLVPGIIEVAGISNSKSLKNMPKDLQNILDKHPKGFIYFSLGSIVGLRNVPKDFPHLLVKVFSKLPYAIIWKLSSSDESNILNLLSKFDNIFTFNWLPQQILLQHPRLKLFITHGGLNSLEEAIRAHVPILGIPLVRDQFPNVKMAEAKGLGLYVDCYNIDEARLTDLILEVISNTTYRENVKKADELIRDQPMTGLEKAVWWTEYVLRHKGAKHLRSPLLDLPTYQYYLLDVIGFCTLVFVVMIYALVVTIKLVLRICKYCVSKTKSKKD